MYAAIISKYHDDEEIAESAPVFIDTSDGHNTATFVFSSKNYDVAIPMTIEDVLELMRVVASLLENSEHGMLVMKYETE